MINYIRSVANGIINYCIKSHMTEKQLEIVNRAIDDLIDSVQNDDYEIMLEKIVHISVGNRKIGNMLNFSLLPGFTCGYWAKRTCLCSGCYALKENRYPAVLYNRVQNTIVAVCAPGWIVNAFIRKIDSMKKKPDFVRFHEAGDFVTDQYLDNIIQLVKMYPEISFYTYSKQYRRILSRAKRIKALNNLEIKISTWPGLPPRAVCMIAKLMAYGFSIATLKNDEYDTEKNNCYDCLSQTEGKTCGECGLCAMRDVNIHFRKH